MRWVPFLITMVIAVLIGLDIALDIKKLDQRQKSYWRLLYAILLDAALFTPISFKGLEIFLLPPGIGFVNLYQINIDVGFLENIIMTLPLGFLIKKDFPQRSVFALLLIGFAIGLTFETTQYYLSHWFLINRTSDINDVLANGIGIAIGAILFLIYRKFFAQKLNNHFIAPKEY